MAAGIHGADVHEWVEIGEDRRGGGREEGAPGAEAEGGGAEEGGAEEGEGDDAGDGHLGLSAVGVLADTGARVGGGMLLVG